MDSDAVAHIFVKMSQRKITILDEAGYEEIVKYKWDDEGSEGFRETIAICLLYTSPSPRD